MFEGDLIFCVPKKAGSLSLDNFFRVAVDQQDYISWHHRSKMPLLPSCNSSEAAERLLTSTRVMIIRHPFHRLASAYQFIFKYSIEETEAKYFEHQASVLLSQGIIEQLRPGSADPQVSFSEFVRFVLDQKTGGFSPPIHQKGLNRWPGGEWSEFGQHWQSISSFCSPCALLPQLVVELDKLSQELPFVLEWSGLSRVYGHLPNLARENAGLVEGKKLAKSLFGELTQSQITDLADFYQDDFMLGGYHSHVSDL